MQRAAIIIKEPQQQYEGLRTCVGLRLAGMGVQLFVLHHEIENMDEDFHKQLVFLDKIGGTRFSNNPKNAQKYGFRRLSMEGAAEKIRQADVIIPF